MFILIENLLVIKKVFDKYDNSSTNKYVEKKYPISLCRKKVPYQFNITVQQLFSFFINTPTCKRHFSIRGKITKYQFCSKVHYMYMQVEKKEL